MRYGLVGDGRVAKHITQYFHLLEIPLIVWSRRNSLEKTGDALRGVDVVLLAISDSAIQPFIDSIVSENPEFKEKKFVHFSGSVTTPVAQGFHPLMAFGEELYDLETYQSLVFIGEAGLPTFEEIFPELPNRHYVLPVQYRGLYHALCVMSGNFTVILWEKFFNTIEGVFKIPRTAAFPYLERVSLNLLKNTAGDASGSVLTGPLQRDDHGTIERNLTSLAGDPFQEVYRAFVSAYSSSLASKNLERKNQHEQRP